MRVWFLVKLTETEIKHYSLSTLERHFSAISSKWSNLLTCNNDIQKRKNWSRKVLVVGKDLTKQTRHTIGTGSITDKAKPKTPENWYLQLPALC